MLLMSMFDYGMVLDLTMAFCGIFFNVQNFYFIFLSISGLDMDDEVVLYIFLVVPICFTSRHNTATSTWIA